MKGRLFSRQRNKDTIFAICPYNEIVSFAKMLIATETRRIKVIYRFEFNQTSVQILVNVEVINLYLDDFI